MTHTPGPGAPLATPGTQIADPAPLGLAGLALAYGGIAQFAAGLWEFTKGNTFGATAFCSYGAFWISFWYLAAKTDLSGASPNNAGNAVGWYLVAWGIFTLYMSVAATRVSNAVLAVFVLLTVTFFLLGIGAIADSRPGTRPSPASRRTRSNGRCFRPGRALDAAWLSYPMEVRPPGTSGVDSRHPCSDPRCLVK